jgi:hypothetical protein
MLQWWLLGAVEEGKFERKREKEERLREIFKKF